MPASRFALNFWTGYPELGSGEILPGACPLSGSHSW